jgi:hypothetical protein
MREYKLTDCSGETVDLDDPKTYERLPKEVRTLDDLMMKEIGQYYCYTHYWHRDVFIDRDSSGQVKRVEKLIKEFTDNRRNNWENPIWFQEQIFLFQDETENMC